MARSWSPRNSRLAATPASGSTTLSTDTDRFSWRDICTPAAGLSIGLVLGVVAIIVAEVAGLPSQRLTYGLTHARDSSVFFGATAVSFAVILTGFIIAVQRIGQHSIQSVIGAWSWRLAGIAFIAWLAISAAGAAVDALIHPANFHVTATGATPLLALMALGALGIQTFTEEFIFRGVVTQSLLRATHRPVAAALESAALFGALHIPNGSLAACEAVLFGFVTSMIAMRTGSLAFGWGMHLANNLFGSVVVISATDVFKGSPGIFTQASQHTGINTVAGLVAFILIAIIAVKATPPATQDPRARAYQIRRR